MENKKVPMRTCIACKANKPKKELIRIVARDNVFELDLTGRANGRGAYVCDNPECVENLLKTKALNKVFKQSVPLEYYEKIKEQYFANR